jgi:hypothetical protein
MEEAEYQNGSTTATLERNLSWILNVCVDCFDRELPLRGGFAKFREGRSIAVDSDDQNVGCCRGECVASAAAGEIDDRAQLGRDLNSRELVTEEVGRRRSLRHGFNRHRVDRQ